jgi:hypothetical protein
MATFPTPAFSFSKLAVPSYWEAASHVPSFFQDQSCWKQRIYVIGDVFTAHGASLPSHLQTVLEAPPLNTLDGSIWNVGDLEIRCLYNAAKQEEEKRKADFNREVERAVADPCNALVDLDHMGILWHQALIRARTDLFGDRFAVAEFARNEGVANEVFEKLENNEASIGDYGEMKDDFEPEWRVIQRDFIVRVNRGEIVLRDGTWFETDELQHVGPRTRICTISKPPHRWQYKGERCPVCIEKFTASRDSVVRLKKCRHIIHAECLDSWINSMAEQCNTCVICRRELFTRRQRQPSGYLEWVAEKYQLWETFESTIEYLRANNDQLVEFLEEMAPSRVAKSLGR